jgi:hypothetical protein
MKRLTCMPHKAVNTSVAVARFADEDDDGIPLLGKLFRTGRR